MMFWCMIALLLCLISQLCLNVATKKKDFPENSLTFGGLVGNTEKHNKWLKWGK